MQTNEIASRYQIVTARRLSEPLQTARAEIRARYRSRKQRSPYTVGVHIDAGDYFCCAVLSEVSPRLPRGSGIYWAAYKDPDTNVIVRFLEAVSPDDMMIVPAPSFPRDCEAVDRRTFMALEERWAAGRKGVVRDECPLHPGRSGVAR